jgi:superfamily II DNA or RNA helicase
MCVGYPPEGPAVLLEDLKQGVHIEGLIPGEVLTILGAQWHGSSAVELTYRTKSGELGQRLVYRADEDRLRPADTGTRSFDAPATDYKLVAEAQRISLAGLFDPMLAVATSDVQPLPHQIRAVYGDLLPRTPLRFLLADDPGAGKTIMAGLYVKELLLRDDVKRCLIVAPGGLVDQWQDELFFKFGLRFDVLTNQLIDSNVNLNVFDTHPLLIARMDQLSRNEFLQDQLKDSEWDLVIVDEAHRMGAHYFGGKLEKTKRFLLGELLGDVTRHLLLMTATPHSGKEEDFQLFLTLLDRDRYEGKNTKTADTTGIMRRMVKEDLLTFDGTPLFPERIAQTVPYELTDLEQELYEEVTAYVRDGMNRAERLLDGKRKNTVGFALTVLQRRLASSPEAIYKSLLRRSARLESRRKQILDGTFHDTLTEIDIDDVDGDDYNAEQLEQAEEELLDAATAAQTIAELEAELLHLSDLAALAKRVRDLGTDRKWTELSTILQEHAIPTMRDGQPRKMIIFTEHRDTLDYLRARISSLLGNPYAVSAIHGGVRRHDRRQITEEFTHNAQCQILLATDAAGEGLNLQAAHLMVNYDLPWNPNRIEQRFGRIHRIGQEEVCRLWNLVAINTREGAVFDRLLEKLEQMRLTYGGKVFDVLGEAFTDTPLRDLLKDAVQYGELPETRAKMHEVIDASIGQGLKELLDERALASEHLSDAQLATLRAAMDEARAMRLQPHYIEMAFKAALARLGGRMAKREKGRYEIANVPAAIRASKFSPIATRYERVTFDLEYVRGDGLATADVLAPGHPLHDAVMFETKRLLEGSLRRGTVLISPAVETPQLLVGVVEEVVDGTSDSVARRFGYAFVDEHGTVSPAGPAPYLDCVAAPEGRVTDHARRMPWLAAAEQQAVSWIVTTQLPEYLNQIRPRREAELRRLRELVQSRLESERDRLTFEAMKASEKERLGDRPRESSESLKRKAAELQARLGRRVERIDKQSQMTTKPPSVATAALVLPLSMVEGELPAAAPMHAKETSEVERRGVELVLARERELGRRPIEQSRNNKGFDILSTNASGETFRIEVKARIEGADDFFITHNEVLTAKNAQPRYRLALVRVDPRGAEHDDVRYVADPFATTELGDFDATGIRGDWARTWAKGSVPF